MSKLAVALMFTVACTQGQDRPLNGNETPNEALVESATPICEPAVRLERDVYVMSGNEWMTGQLAIAVCRGSQAQLGDISALMEWLGEEAREGRIRLCGSAEAMAPVSDADRNTAENKLPGVRDWCFAVVSDV